MQKLNHKLWSRYIKTHWKTYNVRRNTYLLTYFMEQTTSWEANWFSASQKIPRILRISKVHYRIHKCPTTLPILSRIDPVHNLTSHYLKVHLNIILPSTLVSFKRSLSLRFSYQNPECTCPRPYVPHTPSISFSRFDHPKNIGWGIQIIKLLIM